MANTKRSINDKQTGKGKSKNKKRDKKLSYEDQFAVELYMSNRSEKNNTVMTKYLQTHKPTSGEKNKKQGDLDRGIKNYDIVISQGPAGTGKTYVALQTCFNLLSSKNTLCERICMVKSVEPIPSQEIGFIPGTIEEKMEPHLWSFKGNINKIFGDVKAYEKLLEEKVIEFMPLAYVRGVNIDNAFIIIDEAQNLDIHTIKSIMTRVGENSKLILLGDVEQVDLKDKSKSFFSTLCKIFKNHKVATVVEFTDEECVRNPIIPLLLETIRNYTESERT